MCGMTSVRLPHMEFKVIATYNATANSVSKYTIQIPTFYPMYCLQGDRRYLLYPKESPLVRLINMMSLLLPSKRKPFCSAFCHDNFPFFFPRKKTVQQCTAMTLLFSPKLNSFRSAFCHDDVTALLQQKAQWFDIMP